MGIYLSLPRFFNLSVAVLIDFNTITKGYLCRGKNQSFR